MKLKVPNNGEFAGNWVQRSWKTSLSSLVHLYLYAKQRGFSTTKYDYRFLLRTPNPPTPSVCRLKLLTNYFTLSLAVLEVFRNNSPGT